VSTEEASQTWFANLLKNLRSSAEVEEKERCPYLRLFFTPEHMYLHYSACVECAYMVDFYDVQSGVGCKIELRRAGEPPAAYLVATFHECHNKSVTITDVQPEMNEEVLLMYTWLLDELQNV